MKYDNLCVAALRALSIDMINKANSGHPGMALDAAPLLHVLYSRYLKAVPVKANWIDRDRFVLSAGHASALLYAILHLTGYGVSLNDLKEFRQLDSITPGHPEYGLTPGVDCSAGPLGQGLGQAVGMALAETHLRAIYPGSKDLFSHYTYCLVGDGCLEEGISQEAASFAGQNKLNKLIVFYDANGATLDGPLKDSSSEDAVKRFAASGWNVLELKDGNDIEAIAKAIDKARASESKPTFIKMNTLIGYGSINQGTSKTHGTPLGLQDGEHAKKVYGWNYAPFEVPQEVYLTYQESFQARGEKAYVKWEKAKKNYFLKHQQEANFLDDTLENDVAKYALRQLPKFPAGTNEATRNISQQVLNLLQQALPNLIGGAADVASSVKTAIKGGTDFSPAHPEGTIIRYGVREFGMASIANGLLLHGGLRTYVGLFLVFTDYMKAAIRLAALQRLPAIYLLSHDTIAVGEDGPTHQPIEQLAMLRAIPNVRTFRPCDATETAAAWREAMRSTHTPTCIILTRQALPYCATSSADGLIKGGYIVSKEKRKAKVTLIASGSEVALAIKAQELLLDQGIDTRVVSVPEFNLFLAQSEEYRKKVLGNPRTKCLVVEMASPFGWSALADHVMGITTFGKSGKAEDVIPDFGFTPVKVADRAGKIAKAAQ